MNTVASYLITKMDLAAIRAADDLCVHLNAKHPNGLVRLIKRNRPNERDPYAQDVEHILPAPVCLDTTRGRAEHERGLVECFAMIGFYHASPPNHVALAFRMLRAGDEIQFRFYPDANTNGFCAMAGLHADSLFLLVSRAGKTIARVEIDSRIVPANSARMIRGVPNSETYATDAAEARRIA